MYGLFSGNPYDSGNNAFYYPVGDSIKNEKIFEQYQGDSFNTKVKIYPDNSLNYCVAKNDIFGFQTARGKSSSLGFYDPVFSMYDDLKKQHYQHLKLLDIISSSFDSVNAYLLHKQHEREQRQINIIGLEEREKQFLRSLRNSLRVDNLKKTKENLFDYVECNNWDWFFTGTFDPKRYDSQNADELKIVLQKWFNNMVSRYHISYIIIFEYHKKGGIHIHGLIKENPLYPLKLVDSDTKSYYGFKKPMRDNTALKHGLNPANGRVVYNLKTWRFGWSTAIKVYGKSEHIAKYVTKYITKTNQKIMGRYFWHSQDLDKPKVYYMNTDYDALQLAQYHGFKYMYLSGDDEQIQQIIADTANKSKQETFNYNEYTDIFTEIENQEENNSEWLGGWVDL